MPNASPLSAGERTDRAARPARRAGRWREYARALGPGLVTGASDDDPSGIATYSQAGARFRYGLLWAALLTWPLMAAVQEICDRTALATGESLGQLCRDKFERTGRAVMGLLLGCLLVANTANVTADLLAIGAGMNLLHAGPTWLWAMLAGVIITALVVRGSFDAIARVFKYLCLSLFAYVVVLAVVHVSWGDVLGHLLVPHVTRSREYIALLVGVLGTTISPYLFFWQTAHRVEELENDAETDPKDVSLRHLPRRAARHEQHLSRFDVFTGMTLSNLVMFAIIVATGATIGAHGAATINSAADAAKALRPVAGQLSSVLFALGFIGSGFLAVPVLAASASVGLAGLAGKPWGFSRSPRRAPLFYVLVAIGTLGGTALSLAGIDPIRLLVLVAIVNGIAAAPFLVAVMLVSSDTAIMGRYRNGRLARTLGWLTTALMAIAAIALLTLR